MAARHKGGYYYYIITDYYCNTKYPYVCFTRIFSCVSCAAKKGLTIDDVGMSKDTAVFPMIPPVSAGFETGDFVKKKLGDLPQNDSSFELNRHKK